MAVVAMAKAPEPGDDPDAQATITDYLDYTEYLPSDLNRALTLIRKLDETYLERTNNVHELTKEWARVSHWADKPIRSSHTLRREIFYNLQHAIKARESAYGEAERLNEMVNRYHTRLTGIKAKLLALPKPPSKDPTPVAKSPQATKKTPTRLTLRLDGGRNAASTGRMLDKEKKRLHRSRRITIPGEVLPPPNPDSPQEFSESDWDSLPPSPLPVPTSRVGGSRSRSHKRLKIPKLHKPQKDRVPRPPRPPGMGTNVHSQIAGISTSNALSMLPKPPADAEAGSEHAPWMRLTEYEMALLRKRMKKNAIWTPSETMIRRELAAAGRGPDNYRKRRLECDKSGEDLLDVDNIAESSPDKPLLPGEIRADDLGPISESLSNRGMKLNEAKKQKREAMLEASRLETQQATKRIEDLGTNFKLLFEKPRTQSFGSPLTPRFPNGQQRLRDHAGSKKRKGNAHERDAGGSRSAKKRKVDEPDSSTETAAVKLSKPTSVDAETNTEKATSSRRQGDLSTTARKSITSKVPLAPPGPAVSERSSLRIKSNTPASSAAPSKIEDSRRTSKTLADRATPSRNRRVSLTLKGPASPNRPNVAPRSSSRKTSLQTTATPSSATSLRERPQRQSATPVTPITVTPVLTAASRRSKRPAPGAVLQSEEGGAATTIGRRKRPPQNNETAHNAATMDSTERKGNARGKIKALQDHGGVGEEFIDPEEPRYCICGDVSWGNMVCCDNDDCEREWFHFGCVGLTANPSRRTKWYCPDCKVKLGIS